MTILNLTPHPINVYSETSFINLEKTNPTTWLADGVEGEGLASFETVGSVRIATKTVEQAPLEGIPVVATSYGEIEGVPKDAVLGEDTLIVSLPAQSMAKASGSEWATSMLAPYKVVRLRSNTSQVLGCMGFTY